MEATGQWHQWWRPLGHNPRIRPNPYHQQLTLTLWSALGTYQQNKFNMSTTRKQVNRSTKPQNTYQQGKINRSTKHQTSTKQNQQVNKTYQTSTKSTGLQNISKKQNQQVNKTYLKHQQNKSTGQQNIKIPIKKAKSTGQQNIKHQQNKINRSTKHGLGTVMSERAEKFCTESVTVRFQIITWGCTVVHNALSSNSTHGGTRKDNAGAREGTPAS